MKAENKRQTVWYTWAREKFVQNFGM